MADSIETIEEENTQREIEREREKIAEQRLEYAYCENSHLQSGSRTCSGNIRMYIRATNQLQCYSIITHYKQLWLSTIINWMERRLNGFLTLTFLSLSLEFCVIQNTPKKVFVPFFVLLFKGRLWPVAEKNRMKSIDDNGQHCNNGSWYVNMIFLSKIMLKSLFFSVGRTTVVVHSFIEFNGTAFIDDLHNSFHLNVGCVFWFGHFHIVTTYLPNWLK